MYGVFSPGGPPRCGGSWFRACANTGTLTSESANRLAAIAAWRCDDFTVLTSQTLSEVPRDVLPGSLGFSRATTCSRRRSCDNLHGRRGTRTPDFLRVRQAL